MMLVYDNSHSPYRHPRDRLLVSKPSIIKICDDMNYLPLLMSCKW